MNKELNEYKFEEHKEDIAEIKDTVKMIFEILEGKNGLVTRTSLNAASIKRAWWFIAVIITLVLGLAVK